MEPTRKIAIVGGGIAGIGCIAALKEVGLEAVCYERADAYGGTWRYKEESVEDEASIMPTTTLINSKEAGAFSIFPPRKEHNNYMRHDEVLQYLNEYVANRDISRHIIYNSEVTHVKKSEDYEVSGQWTVTVRHTKAGKESTETYDGVLIAVGHINHPKMPTYLGQDEYKGKIMHSHSLKEVEEFKGKNVVVVGMGCSGVDAAVDISSVAKQVYLSARSGRYIMSRIGPNGHPLDTVVFTRFISLALSILSVKVASWIFETVYLDPMYHHKLYTVEPSKPVFCNDPTLNDHIGAKLLSGLVTQKNDIERFTKKGVIFKSNSEVIKCDVVVMATGYTWKFPFLDQEILEYTQEDGIINLYKCMFPPQLPHSTLAFIGFILPLGPGFPVVEIQCRWAAHILAGKGSLPSKDKMDQDIKDRHFQNVARYGPRDKVSIMVDICPYMDDIASQFGVKPNMLKLFLTDIRFFGKLFFGPFLSYQYRLQGPLKWEGAREAIMTSSDRMLWPLKRTDTLDTKENSFIIFIKKILKIMFVIFDIKEYL